MYILLSLCAIRICPPMEDLRGFYTNENNSCDVIQNATTNTYRLLVRIPMRNFSIIYNNIYVVPVRTYQQASIHITSNTLEHIE